MKHGTENDAVFNSVGSISDLRPNIYSNALQAEGTIEGIEKECIVADNCDFADKRFDGILGERSAQSGKHIYQS